MLCLPFLTEYRYKYVRVVCAQENLYPSELAPGPDITSSAKTKIEEICSTNDQNYYVSNTYKTETLLGGQPSAAETAILARRQLRLVELLWSHVFPPGVIQLLQPGLKL